MGRGRALDGGDRVPGDAVALSLGLAPSRTARALLAVALLALLCRGAAQAAPTPPRAPATPTPAPVGGEIEITAGSGAGLHFSPQVAVFGDGGFAVVWGVARDVLAKRVMHVRFFAADGTPATGEFLLAPGPTPPDQVQTPDALIVDGTGNLLLLWEQHDPRTGAKSVYAARLDRTGAFLGRSVRVNQPNALDRFGAVAALAPGGGFVVAWTGVASIPGEPGSTTFDIFFRRLDAAGRPAGPEMVLFAGDDLTMPAVYGAGVAPDGSITLAYGVTDDPDFVATQRVAADGTVGAPRGVTFDLPDFNEQNNPSLSMAADGSYAVVWNDFGVTAEGTARLFAADGTPRGGAFQLTRYAGGNEVPSPGGSAASLPGGGFLAVWTDDSGRDGDGDGVFWRAFSGSGLPLKRDLRLNVNTFGDELSPVIAGNPAGEMVAVWTRNPNGRDTEPEFLLGRRFTTTPAPRLP